MFQYKSYNKNNMIILNNYSKIRWKHIILIKYIKKNL